MDGLLRDKVCLVTGSARGIGRATALLFAAQGGTVIVNGTRPGSAEGWIGESGLAERLHPYYFDVSDAREARRNVQAVRERFGRIDVLVNNAAVEYNERIGMISRAHMEHMLRVNVCGTVEMLQLVSRVMARDGRGGVILNVASATALRGSAGQAVYAATKGAVIALTRSAAVELAPQNIRVNAVAPGLTDTEMLAGTDPERLRERLDRVALGRIARPEEIAGVLLMLASDYAGYVSGQVLAADGCVR